GRAYGLRRLSSRRSERGPLRTAEEAAAYPFTPEEEALAQASRRMLVWGTPATVRRRPDELVTQLAVDELIVTTHIASHEERLLSYRLLAEAFAASDTRVSGP